MCGRRSPACGGAAPCNVGCVAAPLASTHYVPVALFRKNVQKHEPQAMRLRVSRVPAPAVPGELGPSARDKSHPGIIGLHPHQQNLTPRPLTCLGPPSSCPGRKPEPLLSRGAPRSTETQRMSGGLGWCCWAVREVSDSSLGNLTLCNQRL